jgi:hypothetical protein
LAEKLFFNSVFQSVRLNAGKISNKWARTHCEAVRPDCQHRSVRERLFACEKTAGKLSVITGLL